MTGARPTRGSPTSAPSGGGSGGFSNEGSSCSTSKPPPPIAATLPRAFQRIRICPTSAQGRMPAHFSPQPYAKAARSSSMSRIWSSTQSPGFRE
jgi:hypothetical protein